MSQKRSIRSSQLISPFGVGAVVDLAGESLVNMDITKWPAGECTTLKSNNLGRLLGKDIKRPPTDERHAAIPFTRFPRWLFCPSCRRLSHYTLTADAASEFEQPYCTEAKCNKTSLGPMRFVTVCSEGHLGDVDWYFWAHRRQQQSQTGQCSRQTSRLHFETTGASGGDFNAMYIRCSCGAQNTFEGLTDKSSTQKCSGRQPWQNRDSRVECASDEVRVHPRSASNVYYPSVLSSLDIADDMLAQDIETEQVLGQWLEAYQPAIFLRQGSLVGDKSFLENAGIQVMLKQIINEACRQFSMNQDMAKDAILQFLIGGESAPLNENPHDTSQQGLLSTEWPYLSRASGIRTKHLNTRPMQLEKKWPKEYSNLFEQVTIIDRLREVRALIGFKRLRGDKDSKLVPVDLGAGESWLPGVELFGEGIFIKLREKYLADWEKIIEPLLNSRTADLEAKCERWGREPADVHASPRFIALHTFAHGLIRRLAFDAGYSASSLRERIYCSKGSNSMAGILIYTSESDSEGSLGGLARLGDPDRLLETIKRTLIDLAWCSGDPVCSELESQGVDGMNAAACHACSLISETSCMYNNSLLDRRLVIGSGVQNIKGLMANLVN